ncbi:MAG TPA: molybdopterin biosynthesis protein [Firmicutes bacterium]|nr:molybdopterin biosynthesis protein [Bacillota bacterium]
MRKDSVYLETVSREEALLKLLEAVKKAGIEPVEEEVRAEDALGRITSRPVFAAASCPHYAAAAMDGYAVRAADTFGARESAPIWLKVGEKAFYVDTGDAMPEGTDAVIMVEEVNREAGASGEGIEIISPVYPGQNVRQVGEDIVATEMLLPGRQVLGPADIGGLLAAGVTRVKVVRRPRVAVIPTGDELRPAGLGLKAGEIPEFNSAMISGLVREWGGVPVVEKVVPDEFDALVEAVRSAAGHADVVVMNAGSSAGSEDYTAQTVRQLGTLLVHGVAIRPGKPTVLGMVGRVPLVGLPGYPVSCWLSARLFLKPLLCYMSGLPEAPAQTVSARLSRRLVSSGGVEEFVRVKMGRVSGKLIATPLGRGAGLISSVMRADGLVRIPRLSEGYREGETVEVELLRPLAEIESTILMIGSHDVALDLLGAMIGGYKKGIRISSAHVGSLGGLMSLKRGEAHAAPTHLLDEATGEYNVSYVKKYLPGLKCSLVTVARRAQGFIVKKGNPLGIRGISDLLRPGVRFVNRQKGAGTRVLLDYLLKKENLSPSEIQGYQNEQYTHMAVAATVASGAADVGLGILAAARALGLDFVPVDWELYQLCIPEQHRHNPLVECMLELLRSDEFKKQMAGLGGYDVNETGEEIVIT